MSALLLYLVFLVVIACRTTCLAPTFTHSSFHLLRCHIRVEMSNMSKLHPVCAGTQNQKFLTTSEAPPNFCTLRNNRFNQYTLERGEQFMDECWLDSGRCKSSMGMRARANDQHLLGWVGFPLLGVFRNMQHHPSVY